MPHAFPRRSGKLPQRSEMFEQWAVRFPKHNGELAAAVNELVAGHKAFLESVDKTIGDETITEGARLVRNAKTARAKLLPLMDKIDAAQEEASKVVSKLMGVVANAYNPPDPKYPTCMRHAEIRAHVKSLPQGEKLKLVEEARKNGDQDTLLALASCQGFLSGLPPQMHQYTRDHLIELHAPREAAAMKTIQEQQELATKLRDTMLQSVADLIDFRKADELIDAAKSELAA